MKKLYIFTIFLFLHTAVYADSYPERIVSLSPVITEEIFILGADSKLVGVSTYCIKPEAAKYIERTGTLTDINIEKILLLKPDLVLATTMMPKQQLERLRKLNINVLVFSYYESFQDICNQLLRLGKIVGKAKKAKEIIEEVQNNTTEITAKITHLQKPKVFIQIGAKPLYTATGKTYLNDLIRMAGGINITENLSGSGSYSTEETVNQNPDIIIITSMGIETEKEKQKWEQFNNLKAVKNNRIYTIDSYKVCSLSPLSFIDTLREFVQIIHPEEQFSE